MIVLNVEGMSCDHCRKAVEGAVTRTDADARHAVDLETGRVEIWSDLPATRFAAAIEEAGYDVAPPA